MFFFNLESQCFINFSVDLILVLSLENGAVSTCFQAAYLAAGQICSVTVTTNCKLENLYVPAVLDILIKEIISTDCFFTIGCFLKYPSGGGRMIFHFSIVQVRFVFC